MARDALRKMNAALGAVFVPVFLAAMLIQNASVYLRRPIPLGAPAAELLAALGADQYWPMFGAYFPDHARVPVVRVGLRGGGVEFILPAAHPGFSPELMASFDLTRVSDEGRIAEWRFALGTARIEKYESRAASRSDSWLGLRTAYTALQLRRWLEDTGTPVSDVRFIDLLSVSVRSARDGAPLEVVRVQPVELVPELLPDWPAPRARRRFGAQG